MNVYMPLDTCLEGVHVKYICHSDLSPSPDRCVQSDRQINSYVLLPGVAKLPFLLAVRKFNSNKYCRLFA